jgi:hypothetical protein
VSSSYAQKDILIKYDIGASLMTPFLLGGDECIFGNNYEIGINYKIPSKRERFWLFGLEIHQYHLKFKYAETLESTILQNSSFFFVDFPIYYGFKSNKTYLSFGGDISCIFLVNNLIRTISNSTGNTIHSYSDTFFKFIPIIFSPTIEIGRHINEKLSVFANVHANMLIKYPLCFNFNLGISYKLNNR